jgi:hypothetical protein
MIFRSTFLLIARGSWAALTGNDIRLQHHAVRACV